MEPEDQRGNTTEALYQNLLAEGIHIPTLHSIFDKETLASEKAFLMSQLSMTVAYLGSRKSSSVNEVFSNASRDRSMGSALSLFAQFGYSDDVVTERIGITMLGRCLLSVQNAGPKEANLSYGSVVDRCLMRELAAIYVSLWEWFIIHAPRLTRSLWHVLVENKEKHFLHHYPILAPIFLSLCKAVENWYLFNPERQKKSRRKLASNPYDLILEKDQFLKCGSIHVKAPDTLKISLGSIAVPNPNRRTSLRFQQLVSDLFIEVLYRMVMHPYLAGLFKDLTDKRSSKEAARTRYKVTPNLPFTNLRNILVVRGGISHMLLQIFCTESIYALPQIHQLIKQPYKFFSHTSCQNHGYRHSSLANVFSNIDYVDELIDVAREEVRKLEGEYEDFQKMSSEIAHTLYRHTLQLETKRIISDKEFLDRRSLVTPSDEQALFNKGLSARQSAEDKEPLSFDDLVEKGYLTDPDLNLNLHLLAVMIREALRHCRLNPDTRGSLSDDDYRLYNMQLGRNLKTGKRLRVDNEDHMNIIRENLPYVACVRKAFDLERVKTAIGSVNHIIWFATGQCTQTEELQAIPPLYFDSPDDIRIKIRTAQDRGLRWREMENMTLWGTANDWLSWRGHGEREKPEERFGRLFEPLQLEQIQLFLDESDTDPESGKRRTWGDVHDWIAKDIHFRGVNNLTLLQLTNNLAYLGLCEKPSFDELAAWISNNDLGAISGLEFLGFKKTLGQPRRTRTALMLLYTHLEEHLLKEDQDTLTLDTVLLEHILCKVSRWLKVYNRQVKSGQASFSDFALKVCRSAPQFDGQTTLSEANPDILPIPLTFSEDTIRKVMTYANNNKIFSII